MVVAAAGAGCGSRDQPVVTSGPTDETTVPTSLAPETTTVASTTASTGRAPPPPTTATTVPAIVTTRATSDSGVRGTVTAGPTCGVERVDMPCPPVPVSATVEAITSAGRVAGRGRTDGAGHYAIDLEPGRYTLRVAGTGTYPRCPDTDVVVVPGNAATADISCDTGIR